MSPIKKGLIIDNLDQIRADKKRKMAESLWNLAIEAKEAITRAKLEKSSAAQLVIVMATLVDKALLLVGDVTDRLALVDERELDRKLNELETAEKELKDAWKRALENRKKAAAEQEKSSTE